MQDERLHFAKQLSAHFPMERDIEAPFNDKEQIFIKDVEGLKKKIELIKKDGASKLYVLTDFDYTLTRKTINGHKADNSFKAIENPKVIGKEFEEGCNRAREKFGPIESDPTLSKEVKEKSMFEWWKQTQNLMIETKLSKEIIRRAVSVSNLYLRNGCTELFKVSQEAGTKIHIVSGGIKCVVNESYYILQMQRGFTIGDTLVYCMTPEIYSPEGVIVGFEEPTIITTNKHECMNHKAYPEIKEGGNAIVMGDLVEDFLIVKNLKMKQVIGIGFLNAYDEAKPEQLAKYLEVYDIVLVNDGNLNHVVELVKFLTGLPLSSTYIGLGPSAKMFSAFLK